MGCQKFIDPLPGRRADGFETLVHTRVVHDRLLPRPDEVLPEFALGDADHRFPVGQPFHHHHDQRPQDRLRGEIGLPALPAIPFGELEKVLVYRIEYLWDVVESDADPLVLFPILSYGFG